MNAGNRKMSPPPAQGGFTLLELLIVILIIGVLATLAVPRYINFIERSRAAEAVQVLNAIKSAQLAYRLEHGTFAGTLPDLDVEVPSGNGYWVYDLVSGTPASYYATATRTAKDAAPEFIGKYIELFYDNVSGVYWCGDHVGRPRELD